MSKATNLINTHQQSRGQQNHHILDRSCHVVAVPIQTTSHRLYGMQNRKMQYRRPSKQFSRSERRVESPYNCSVPTKCSEVSYMHMKSTARFSRPLPQDSSPKRDKNHIFENRIKRNELGLLC